MTSPQDRKTLNRIPPLLLAGILTAALACFSFYPRISTNLRLQESFWLAAGLLLIGILILRTRASRAGRVLSYDFVPNRVHYVQLTMHSCIYAYWGWYWREVYRYIPLIIAQVAFVYAFDMLVCWFRRDKWVLGFGPFPIVLSTNLFLWFRDDWFYLQFLMLAVGVLGKEFIKWNRQGRLTHIFNPSGLSLSVFSLALLLTQKTPISWGESIASTLARPPHIYLEIFLIGLIVQGLFGVTLVTLSAAGALYFLNLGFTGWTGVYHFIDSNIPVSVFLGLHLLVTDPATSPRSNWGKLVFGALYGAGVFALYGLLGALGAPRFYDKLLCVPMLNLTVRSLDRMGYWVSQRLRAMPGKEWTPARVNLAHMAVWSTLFVVMAATGFVGKSHPGQQPEFWETACQQGRFGACQTWQRTLMISCGSNQARQCVKLGKILDGGQVVRRDPPEAGRAFGRACDLGDPDGCASLGEFIRAGGANVLLQSCNAHDGASCFILGSLLHLGLGFAKDDSRAADLFRQSCASNWFRGCGRLGESYLYGEGTTVDYGNARRSFEKACQGGYGPSCFNLAVMYRRGMGVSADDAVVHRRMLEACRLGIQQACPDGDHPDNPEPGPVEPDKSGRTGPG